MFLLIAGTILLLLLYCFLRNSETASVLHHQSIPYSRALFDYDQQFIVYNENELEVDSTTHSLRSFGEYSTNRNDCILFFPLEYDYPTIRYPIPFRSTISMRRIVIVTTAYNNLFLEEWKQVL